MKDCIFCKIVAGQEPCHKIWENEHHLAFLSIFPNTAGFSVVITKQHYSSYGFAVPSEVLSKLVLAAKTVGLLLDRKLPGVGRTGMIMEGFGVNHLHIKLIPMHATADQTQWKAIHSNVDKFFERYEGYLSSHDYRRAEDKELEKLAKQIREGETQ